MPASILFVHQGFELYGSDRTLIQSVQAVACRWPGARITVLIPREGRLQQALLAVVQDVRIVDLAILRKSNLRRMKFGDAGSFFRKIGAARHMMSDYDVTYINTVMVMDYTIAAALTRGARILHVHEIPTGPAALFFSLLMALSRAYALFNSQATRRGFLVPFWQRRAVAWNGVRGPGEVPARAGGPSLHLLMIGRFNAWKGQLMLLRAVAQLPADRRNRLQVRLVGSVFGDQSQFAEQLFQFIQQESLAETVDMCPFTPDTSAHYAWADVVVVPSTRPEPFGLVAIEAMAAGRSVIAANHGGLKEIVRDGVTGRLITPGSAQELVAAIEGYIEDPARAGVEGIAGRARFLAEFEESRYKQKIVETIAQLCGETGS